MNVRRISMHFLGTELRTERARDGTSRVAEEER